jgi:hypothetical protein
MSALPRQTCPVCGRSVPVRRNGAFREHKAVVGGQLLCGGSAMRTSQTGKIR